MLFEDAGGLLVSEEEEDEDEEEGVFLNLGVPEFSFERNEMVRELIKGEERRRMS